MVFDDVHLHGGSRRTNRMLAFALLLINRLQAQKDLFELLLFGCRRRVQELLSDLADLDRDDLAR